MYQYICIHRYRVSREPALLYWRIPRQLVSNLCRRGLKVLAAAPPRRGTIGAEAKMPDWLKTSSHISSISIGIAAREPAL